MAITMACALFGALVYSLVFFPALLVLLVPPPKSGGPKWVGWLEERYANSLGAAMRKKWVIAGVVGVMLVVSGIALRTRGADFVPRIEEGDAVGRRSPRAIDRLVGQRARPPSRARPVGVPRGRLGARLNGPAALRWRPIRRGSTRPTSSFT